MSQPLKGEAKELAVKINKCVGKGRPDAASQALEHIRRLKKIPMAQAPILAALNDEARKLYNS